jgi:hypothetical protein
LTRGIPDLSLDGLIVDLDAARGELDADRGLAVEVEFVSRESREEIGFADTRISDQDDLEEKLQQKVMSVRALSVHEVPRRTYVVFVVGHFEVSRRFVVEGYLVEVTLEWWGADR